MHLHRRRAAFFSLISSAALVSASLAGTPVLRTAPPAPAPEPLSGERFRIVLSSQYEFSDDSPAGPGGDTLHSRVTIPFYLPINDSWRVIGLVRGGFSDYESNPFGADDFQAWDVGALVTVEHDITDAWSVAIGGIAGASWEDGASFSDSLNFGGLVMAGYRFSPTLKVGLGALYLNRTNEDPLVIPAVGLEWKASDLLAITLYGLDLRAQYELSSAWSVYLRGEYDPNSALLENRQGSDNDSFDDQGFRAAGGVQWTPIPSFSLSLEGGFAFHEYTLRNDQEQVLAKDRMDPAPFVGVSARLSF